MKCVRCGQDIKYRDRKDGRCPRCDNLFVCEPGTGISDLGFKNAIDAVSSRGQIRFTLDNLYYEYCRRIRSRPLPTGCILGLLVFSVLMVPVAITQGHRFAGLWVAVVVPWLVSLIAVIHKARSHLAGRTREQFRDIYDRWVKVHGEPELLIRRRDNLPASPSPLPEDVADYSFDRVVVCDRADTVDLLLANNFHFENNCAVLGVEGYPPGPFATVRAMLRRNPRLEVYVLHDATPAGCRLARQVATDPEWFAAMQVRVVDVGLRPGQAERLFAVLQRAEETVQPDEAISEREARWLSNYFCELAAIRPEQMLRHLFGALHRHADLAPYTGAAAGAAIAHDGGAFVHTSEDIETRVDSFG